MSRRITEKDIDEASNVLREQIALVEGPLWAERDGKESALCRYGSTLYAIDQFIRGNPDEHTIVIYGGSGISRYFILEDGTVTFSESHNRQRADKARAVGFTVV